MAMNEAAPTYGVWQTYLERYAPIWKTPIHNGEGNKNKGPLIKLLPCRLSQQW
jgi:hypothetical protein